MLLYSENGHEIICMILKYPLRLFFPESFSYFFKEESVYLKGHEKISPITIHRLNLSRASYTGKHILAFTPLLL